MLPLTSRPYTNVTGRIVGKDMSATLISRGLIINSHRHFARKRMLKALPDEYA